MSEALRPEPMQRAWSFESQHSGEFLRLERLLRGRRSFTLVLLTYTDSVYRQHVVDYLDGLLGTAAQIDARDVKGDFTALEDRIAKAAEAREAVQVLGLEDWPLGPAKLWQAFNYHRERIAKLCKAPLLLWILRGKVGDLALEAPDFWAWRNGVFDFGNEPQQLDSPVFAHRMGHLGRSTATERKQRIREITDYLADRGQLSHPADLGLLSERARLRRDLGDIAGALTDFHEVALGYGNQGDRRGEAVAKRDSADVLAILGQKTEALRILREECLPVFGQLKDKRQMAITLGYIADILKTQDKLDEALRIREQEVLPTFEELGDIRSRMMALTRLGLLYLSRAAEGDRERAAELFHRALDDAEKLRIPEAETIRGFLEGLKE